MNEEQVTQEFIERLRALLLEYNAELVADDHWSGYPECGEDIRMTVTIPGIYDCGETIREYTEIDLGQYFTGT